MLGVSCGWLTHHELGGRYYEMSDIEKELTLIRKAIEKMDRGLLVVTRAWRVGLISDRARGWLAKYFGRESSTVDCIPEPLQEWIIEQETGLPAQIGDDFSFKTLAVHNSGERLMARLVTDSEQHMLILKEQPLSTRTVLVDSFGLTPRESEVLFWVARGKSNEEIARILAISHRTVGKHLEHVYAKIGVETRTSAATFVLTSN